VADSNRAFPPGGKQHFEVDWNNAGRYYGELRESVEGIPHNLLKYYCAKTPYGSITEIYTHKTEEAVAWLCPHK
jgi:hypothetical protein